jgi:hypothetical protein
MELIAGDVEAFRSGCFEPSSALRLDWRENRVAFARAMPIVLMSPLGSFRNETVSPPSWLFAPGRLDSEHARGSPEAYLEGLGFIVGDDTTESPGPARLQQTTVLGSAFRMRCLSLAKSCSMGSRSGL